MKSLIITIALLVAVPVYGQVTEMTAVDSPVISADAHEMSEVDETVSESTPRESRSSSGGRSEHYTLLLQYIELLKAYIALLGR